MSLVEVVAWILNLGVLWQERVIAVRALLTYGEDWENYQI